MTRTVETTCDYCGEGVDSAERGGNFVVTLECYRRSDVPNILGVI